MVENEIERRSNPSQRNESSLFGHAPGPRRRGLTCKWISFWPERPGVTATGFQGAIWAWTGASRYQNLDADSGDADVRKGLQELDHPVTRTPVSHEYILNSFEDRICRERSKHSLEIGPLWRTVIGRDLF